MSDAFLIDHLVIVAGLRGAGKTTFSRLLVKGEVSENVLRAIFGDRSPDDYTEHFLKMEHTLTKAEIEGLGPLAIVQSNPLMALKPQYGSYDNVPFFDVLPHVHRVTVVTIQPEAKRLAKQWWMRRVETAAKTNRLRALWVWINYYLQPLQFWKRIDPKKRHQTTNLYRFPEEIERAYDDWRAFFRAKRNDRQTIDLVTLSTVGNRPGPGSFVIDQARSEQVPTGQR